MCASWPLSDTPMTARPWLSVVMPAFNEAANLERSVEALLGKLSELGLEAEILVVDDASRDGTGALAEALAAKHASVRVFHHLHNLGIGGGFLTGVRQARGEWFILIPADLALDLNELKHYFEAAPQGDIVVGVSSERTDYTAFRRLVSWWNIHLIQRLFGMRLRQFNFISLYRLESLRQITIDHWHSAFFFAEILIKAQALGQRLTEVEIAYVPRTRGPATGVRFTLIAATVRDLVVFWLGWQAYGLSRGMPRSGRC
jgi:glycosyltransferase involved in cell wall biosynthesis